jgi:hypothetical protein
MFVDTISAKSKPELLYANTFQKQSCGNKNAVPWGHVIEFISYDGKYPNLCCGTLTFSVNGEVRKTRGLGCGGSWQPNGEGVYKGDWALREDEPAFKDFSKWDLCFLTAEVNQRVPKGCCGGCL